MASLINLLFICFIYLEIQALLQGLDLLLGILRAALVVVGALEGRILDLAVELDLRLST